MLKPPTTSTILALIGLASSGGCARSTLPVVHALPAPPAAHTVAVELPSPRDEVESFERVFFAYDSARLVPEALDVIAANAEVLQANPGLEIRIVGHADERGTTDHNLALGHARAQAIHDALIGHGVAADQLSVATHGEEHPLGHGSGEVAWSKDRRVEFRVLDDPRGLVRGTVGLPPRVSAGLMDRDRDGRPDGQGG